jgi:hypothetical protein
MTEPTFTSEEIKRTLWHYNIKPSPSELKGALDDLLLFSIFSQKGIDYEFMPKRFPEIIRKAFDIEIELEAYREEWLEERSL